MTHAASFLLRSTISPRNFWRQTGFWLGLPLLFATRLTIAAPPDAPPASTASSVYRDLFNDTWVGTDALGRALPVAGEARAPQNGKIVGVFYFLWQGEHGTPGPNDLTKIIAANPDAPAYGPLSSFHWWGEPAVGYFRATDPWVARKNVAMLTDAGVDVLFLDVTNAFTYPAPLQTLCEALEDLRRSGQRPPQIAFVTHARGGTTVMQLYNDFYSKGRFPDLWFRWDGKPLILGDPDAKQDDGTPISPAAHDAFTWRDSWAWQPGQDKWQWIDNYPQRTGWHTDPNVAEELPVSIAGHPTSNLGRSFTGAPGKGGQEPPLNALKLADDHAKGTYFGLQWQRALEVDPQVIFVTGWNEWVAQRFESTNGGPQFLGRNLNKGETYFVDLYNEEFSRDAMPMKGGHTDNYFMQMLGGIRRFKGARPLPLATGFHTLPLSGPWEAWDTIQPEYYDAKGDITHRDWAGWGNLHYTEASGRNDIVSAKVACDANNLSFYARTAQPLTPSTDPQWMQLLLDTDHNPQTGWNGYDFEVNRRVLDAKTTTLTNLKDGKVWRIGYRAEGSQLVVTVPRKLLNLTAADTLTFDFHWLDGAPIGGEVSDLWYHGDNAPDGRFNYRFTWTR